MAAAAADARAIADELTARQVSLNLGGSVYDPTGAVGRLLWGVLAMVAEFEADLIRLRTREGMRVAKAKGHLRGKQPKLNWRQEAHLVSLVDGGDYTTAEVAEMLGLARSDVYRAIERQRCEAHADQESPADEGPSSRCPAWHTAAGHRSAEAQNPCIVTEVGWVCGTTARQRRLGRRRPARGPRRARRGSGQ